MDTSTPQPNPHHEPQHAPPPAAAAFAAAPPPYYQGPPPAKRSTTRRLIVVLAVVAAIVSVPLLAFAMLLGTLATLTAGAAEENKAQEQYREHPGTSKDGGDKVAIITLRGAILDGEGFVKDQIDKVRKDENVKAVVLRIDSPGGTVTGSDYLYHHLKQLREDRDIPLVVSMGSIAASGGYYIAMAVGDEEKSIYAEPTTWTGSIGVIIPHYDLSGLLEKYNIEEDSIRSHPRKQALSWTRSRTEEEKKDHRQLAQQLVNESFGRFKQIVLAGRPKLAAQANGKGGEPLDDIATGEVFSATQAKENGLIDEIGFIEDAIDRAIELAHLTRSNTRVVRYKRPPTLLGSLTGMDVKSQSPRLDAAALLDLTTPRAYYLFTTVPTIAVSGAN